MKEQTIENKYKILREKLDDYLNSNDFIEKSIYDENYLELMKFLTGDWIKDFLLLPSIRVKPISEFNMFTSNDLYEHTIEEMKEFMNDKSLFKFQLYDFIIKEGEILIRGKWNYEEENNEVKDFLKNSNLNDSWFKQEQIRNMGKTLVVLHQHGDDKESLIQQLKTMINGIETNFKYFAG